MNRLCGCGCGKEVKLFTSNFLQGHSTRKSEIREKMKNTCLLHYGVENPYQSSIIQTKRKNTCIKIYGFNHPMKSLKSKEKSKQTCLEKYGVKFVLQDNKVRSLSKQTCLEKYGVDNVFKSKNIQEKIKQTYFKKYGTTHWSSTYWGMLLHRKYACDKIESQYLNGQPLMPRIGLKEYTVFDELQKYITYQIIRNDIIFCREIRRYPDAWIPDLKLIIEFDEFYHDDIKQREKDYIRDLEVAAYLGCIIFRIKEQQWKENKEKVISDFKLLIDVLK